MKAQACANPLNKLVCPGDLSVASTATVQQVCDLAFFKRGERWVDSRLIGAAAPGAPREVRFGSDEFRTLLDRLTAEGRQGTIALSGEILIEVDGEAILVHGPRGERAGAGGDE
jgi:hypothetical protein